MSDTIVRFIPADPYHRLDEATRQRVVDYLKRTMKADIWDVQWQEKPFFVDCGGNLDVIKCPVCGETLDFRWWGDAMDASFEHEFSDLTVTLPCCNAVSSLNDLRYDFLCGFACEMVGLLNPPADPDAAVLAAVERLIGCPVHVIYAHY
ncbi:MAG: hypothetical protein J1E43_02705 [Christensenellaceae bacterium]|nr:hypothetical protein [Christensenellaceae bacterium]